MNSQHTDTEPAKRLSQPTTESKPCSVGNKDSSNRNLNTEPVGIRFCIPSHGKPGDAVTPFTEKDCYPRTTILPWRRPLLGFRLIYLTHSASGSNYSELSIKYFSPALASPNAIFLTTSLSGGDTGM